MIPLANIMCTVLTMLWIDSGQQLCQDDPSALKDIIGIVQKKLSDQDDLLKYTYHSHRPALTNPYFLCTAHVPVS